MILFCFQNRTVLTVSLISEDNAILLALDIAKLSLCMPDRDIVSAAPQEGDQQLAAELRPRRLADFTGQTKLKANLSIAIEAAKRRGEAMDHVLLYGPPGLGKTTLAAIIAEELEVMFTTTSG